MQDLERIRYTTRYYEALKGLKAVPFGLFMLVMAAQELGVPWLGRQGNCTYTLPLFFLMLALYFAADQYYKRTFGFVQVQAQSVSWLSTLALLSLFFGVIALEIAVKPPVSLIGLTIGALLVYAGIRTRRSYYSIAGAAMAGISLVPLLFPAVTIQRQFGTFGFWWNLVMGVVWVGLGLADHVKLVKAFKPVPGGKDA